MKETFDQISFYGNKVLKLEKAPDTAWFNAYKDLNAAILAFVQKRVDSISRWTGKEASSGAEAYFKSMQDQSISGSLLSGQQSVSNTKQSSPVTSASTGSSLATEY